MGGLRRHVHWVRCRCHLPLNYRKWPWGLLRLRQPHRHACGPDLRANEESVISTQFSTSPLSGHRQPISTSSSPVAESLLAIAPTEPMVTYGVKFTINLMSFLQSLGDTTDTVYTNPVISAQVDLSQGTISTTLPQKFDASQIDVTVTATNPVTHKIHTAIFPIAVVKTIPTTASHSSTRATPSVLCLRIPSKQRRQHHANTRLRLPRVVRRLHQPKAVLLQELVL